MYVYTYTYSKRLSPRLLWVPKFDFKLGCLGHEFQNYPIIATFLKFDVKSMLFFFQFKHYFRLFWILFSKVCFSKTPHYGDEKKRSKYFFFISKLPYNIDFSEIWCQKYALFFQFKHYFRLFWILFSKVCVFKNTLLWWRKKKVKNYFFFKIPI